MTIEHDKVQSFVSRNGMRVDVRAGRIVDGPTVGVVVPAPGVDQLGKLYEEMRERDRQNDREADYDDLKEALGLISQHAAGTITQAEQLRRALAISERARERHSR